MIGAEATVALEVDGVIIAQTDLVQPAEPGQVAEPAQLAHVQATG